MKIILVGKAASGKDFFRNYLSNIEELDVSYTTRPPRTGEVEGYTYNYIGEEKFLEMMEDNKFYEAVNFAGWWYGTSKENWENKTVFIMTPSGIEHITEEDRKGCIFVYFDMPIDVRRKRLQERSDFDKVERRLKADEEDFEKFTNFDIRVTTPFFDCAALYDLIVYFEKLKYYESI